MPPKPVANTKNVEEYARNKLATLLVEIREKIGAEGLVRCIKRSVSKEELQNHLSSFAKHVAEQSKGEPALEEVIAKAAQSCIGGRSKARQLVRVPGFRLWGRVKKNVAKQRPGRKSKIHSKAIADKVRIYLLENTTVTSKLMKCKGQVLPVYNLKGSRSRLWARSEAMQALMSRPVWYKHLKAHHGNFVRLKCRTDVCTFCHKYDKVLLPALRKDLTAAHEQVENASSNYFSDLDAHWQAMKQHLSYPDDALSLQYVKFFKLFLDKNAEERMRQPTPVGTVASRQQLKEAEAAASSSLAKYVEILQSCSHHFHTVRRQHSQREQDSFVSI